MMLNRTFKEDFDKGYKGYFQARSSKFEILVDDICKTLKLLHLKRYLRLT